MDDIKWIYYLIALIYGIIIAIHSINHILVKQVIEQASQKAIIIKAFKRDFFTTIACICIVGMLFINSLCLMAGKPLNKDSILTCLLIVGMALLSGFIKIIVVEDQILLIEAYKFNKGDIKSYSTKKFIKFVNYSIRFSEQLNGYESAQLLVSLKQKKVLNTMIDKFIV